MRAKKSLGQNFLNNADVVNDIITAGNVSSGDFVLEVGPGKGVLTEALLARGAHVLAVEKDDRMIPYLSDKFKKEIEAKKFELVHGDILLFDPKQVSLPYKLIANIPYYITGELFRKFFETENRPERMVVMVQKEVAERIAANDGKESILSLSIKVFGKPHYVQTVPRDFFDPAPNVDSAILLVDHISNAFFTESKIDEKKFFELIKAGFAHKRKVLIKNLEALTTREKLETIFEEIKIPRTARAEELSLETWKKIVEKI